MLKYLECAAQVAGECATQVVECFSVALILILQLPIPRQQDTHHSVQAVRLRICCFGIHWFEAHRQRVSGDSLQTLHGVAGVAMTLTVVEPFGTMPTVGMVVGFKISVHLTV